MSAAFLKRIRNKSLLPLVMDAEQASHFIKDGMVVGVSGFTPSGHPKAVPLALAERLRKHPQDFKVTLYSGSSLGAEIDENWAQLGMIARRLPYQTSDTLRDSINRGTVHYTDMHLSHSPRYIKNGVLPPVDIAIIEAAAITEAGHLIPTLSVGSSPTMIQQAKQVIVEINTQKSLALEGMADIYDVEGDGRPIPLTHPGQRIGTPYMKCGPDKIAAIVESDLQDITRPLQKPDQVSEQISAHILEFFRNEVAAGRLPVNLYPLQSGVGNIANAVLYGLCEAEFENLICYTETVQDSMFDLLRSGKALLASTTTVSPSPEGLARFEKELDFFKDKIIMRPQEISNHPELIRRFDVIAINTALEIDIYGNANSTHFSGTHMMNGIGGSGDFTRNAAISLFTTASTAKQGKISCVVPMVSHVDHTEHDVMVMVTEYGYADLRGLSPRERALKIIHNCAHPDYRPYLLDYFTRACVQVGGQTPHLLEEAFTLHRRYQETGSMR